MKLIWFTWKENLNTSSLAGQESKLFLANLEAAGLHWYQTPLLTHGAQGRPAAHPSFKPSTGELHHCRKTSESSDRGTGPKETGSEAQLTAPSCPALPSPAPPLQALPGKAPRQWNACTSKSYGHPLEKIHKILNIRTFLGYCLEKLLGVFLQWL